MGISAERTASRVYLGTAIPSARRCQSPVTLPTTEYSDRWLALGAYLKTFETEGGARKYST